MQISDLSIKQLTLDSLSTKDNGLRLAELIYMADPYIYPAMFGDLERAKLLLPELIKRDDPLFGYSHCLVAESQGLIVGTIYCRKGNINWSPQLLKEIAKDKNVQEAKYLDLVAKEYVSIYAKKRENILSFYSLCVNPTYRGNGIARKLFEKGIEDHPNCPMKLSVLADNYGAIKLNKELGFYEKERYTGFSINEPKPISILMVRD